MSKSDERETQEAEPDPPRLCATAEVVEAVRAWQVAERDTEQLHAWAALGKMTSLLRTATLRTEADVRADERERWLTDFRAIACGGSRDRMIRIAEDAIRAKGDDDA